MEIFLHELPRDASDIIQVKTNLGDHMHLMIQYQRFLFWYGDGYFLLVGFIVFLIS